MAGRSTRITGEGGGMMKDSNYAQVYFCSYSSLFLMTSSTSAYHWLVAQAMANVSDWHINYMQLS